MSASNTDERLHSPENCRCNCGSTSSLSQAASLRNSSDEDSRGIQQSQQISDVSDSGASLFGSDSDVEVKQQTTLPAQAETFSAESKLIGPQSEAALPIASTQRSTEGIAGNQAECPSTSSAVLTEAVSELSDSGESLFGSDEDKQVATQDSSAEKTPSLAELYGIPSGEWDALPQLNGARDSDGDNHDY